MLLNWQKLVYWLIGFILLVLLCYIFGGAICLVKKEGCGLQTFPGDLEFFGFSQQTHPRCIAYLQKKQPSVLHNAARPELKVWVFSFPSAHKP